MPVDFLKLPSKQPVRENPPSRCFWTCLIVYPLGIATFVVLRRYSMYEGRRLDFIVWNTYAFYGDDEEHKTWGNVVWESKLNPVLKWTESYAKVDSLESGEVIRDSGTGSQSLLQRSGGDPVYMEYNLRPAEENGDGTVPVRSGRAPAGQSGVQACVAYPGVDHEKAYKGRTQQLFALWAVTRVVTSVKGTLLEYKS